MTTPDYSLDTDTPKRKDILATLTAMCEEGMTTVLDGYVTRCPTYGPLGGLGEGVPFVTFCNGALKPEGGALVPAATFEDAARMFAEGWPSFRAAHPGNVLLWRLRPEFRGTDTAWSGVEGEEANISYRMCMARLLIVDETPAKPQTRVVTLPAHPEGCETFPPGAWEWIEHAGVSRWRFTPCEE